MRVLLMFQLHGNHDQPPVTHSALRDDMVSEVLDVLCFAPEYGHFHASLVI